MKSLLFYLLFASFATLVQAQTADEIMKNTKEHYQANQSFSANIKFEIDVPEISTQTYAGKVYLKGEKYRFVLDDQEFISDNVTQWHWLKNGVNEVQLSYVANNENAITPSRVFGKYLEGSQYSIINQTQIGEAFLTEVEIIPNQNIDSEFFKVKVVVNQNSEVQQMTLFSKDNGAVYRFSISNEQVVQDMDDKMFEFQKQENPNVEFIDLR